MRDNGDTDELEHLDITSDEFAEEMAMAGRQAREEAFASGFPIVYVDEQGRYVQEFPDGRLFEIRFDSSQPREAAIVVIRELQRQAA